MNFQLGDLERFREEDRIWVEPWKLGRALIYPVRSCGSWSFLLSVNSEFLKGKDVDFHLSLSSPSIEPGKQSVLHKCRLSPINNDDRRRRRSHTNRISHIYSFMEFMLCFKWWNTSSHLTIPAIPEQGIIITRSTPHLPLDRWGNWGLEGALPTPGPTLVISRIGFTLGSLEFQTHDHDII